MPRRHGSFLALGHVLGPTHSGLRTVYLGCWPRRWTGPIIYMHIHSYWCRFGCGALMRTLIGPWSLRGFILHCIYILTNIFCSAYRIRSVVEASKRTGIFLLINLMPLYFGPHLDLLAELLGVSSYDLHTVHGSAAVTSVLLSAAYALFSVFGGQWNALAWFPRPYALIVRLIHKSLGRDESYSARPPWIIGRLLHLRRVAMVFPIKIYLNTFSMGSGVDVRFFICGRPSSVLTTY